MKKIIIYSLFVLAVLSCDKADMAIDNGGLISTGTGGSTAKFTVKNDNLYALDGKNLLTYDVTQSPKLLSNVPVVREGLETIFTFKNNLFIGANDGVYIYDISNAAQPNYMSKIEHWVSCDPVVADGEYAYSTLRSSGRCARGINVLLVSDIKNIRNPFNVAELNMFNPKGLAVNGNMLFVCDQGIKIFDITNKDNPEILYHFTNIDANDVIAQGNEIMVIGNDGVYQYDFDGTKLNLLSAIPIEN